MRKVPHTSGSSSRPDSGTPKEGGTPPLDINIFRPDLEKLYFLVDRGDMRIEHVFSRCFQISAENVEREHFQQKVREICRRENYVQEHPRKRIWSRDRSTTSYCALVDFGWVAVWQLKAHKGFTGHESDKSE